MISLEELISVDRDDIESAAGRLTKEDLPQLVQWLSEKNDKIRYPAFLLLQARSLINADVYPFWHVFVGKLKDANSFQRNIGLSLIACNAAWADKMEMDAVIDGYPRLTEDEKPITIRQCIQSLRYIVPYHRQLHEKISRKLMSIDLSTISETMRKFVLFDITDILIRINGYVKRRRGRGVYLLRLNGRLTR